MAEVIELVGRCQSQDANPGGLTLKTTETDCGSSETKAFPVPPIPELKWFRMELGYDGFPGLHPKQWMIYLYLTRTLE